MKKVLSLVLSATMLISMCTVLTACGGTSKGSSESTAASTATTSQTATATVPEGIQTGTSVTMRVDKMTTTQLPYNDFGTELTNKQMYDTLFYAVNGDYTNIQGLLATDCTISDDGLTATMKIAEGVKFTNGDTLDANAIVAAFDIAKTGMSASMYFQNVASYRAVDANTLEMTFVGPYANFKNDFAQSFTSIFDAKVVQQLGDTDPKAAVGSGPYIVDSFTTGDSLVFKANTGYWFKDRMPHIETINLKIIPDENTALMALQSGEIQVLSTTNVAIYNTAKTVSNIKPVQVVADAFIMWYNENNSVLANPKVRQALTYLIDVDAINQGAFDGNGTPISGGPWTDKTDLAATPTDGYTYNEEKGLALLKEAGVDPSTITLKTLDWAGTTAVNTVVQAQLKKVGITLDFTSASSPGDIMPDEMAGNWDVIINSGAFSAADPISAFTNLISPKPMIKVAHFETADPAIDQKLTDGINTALTAKTIDDQFAALKSVDQTLTDNYAYAFSILSPQWHLYDSDKIANYVVDGSVPQWLMCYAYVIQ
jgi:peptide/nickel transport system substrate-binding protein